MESEKRTGTGGREEVSGESREPEVREWVPLSVREARRARSTRDDIWLHVWMTFASIFMLSAALAIMAYRIGAQSCR